MVDHPFEATYDEHSEILILGTFPSGHSREAGYYYGHPRNRFWEVLSTVFKENQPLKTIDGKKAFLLRHKVAIWDVVASCEIDGASDATIRNVTANDIERVLLTSKIRKIYANGRKAEELYNEHLASELGRPIIYLPSTSPANAAWSLERLVKEWGKISKMGF